MFGIQGRFITVPNLLSISRGVLIVPTMYFAVAGGMVNLTIAACLGILMILSDIADGVVARKTGAISEWGKILDPLVDKFCIFIAGVSAIIWRDFPLWAAIIIFGRDASILIAAYYLFAKKKVLSMSHPVGKYTALATALTLVCYLVPWDEGKIYFLYLTLILIVTSGIFYLVKAIESLKGNRNGVIIRK